MWCSELDVTLDPRNPQALEEYVAGFFPEMPSSGLALEGLLLEGDGIGSATDPGLEFRVLVAHGPWRRQLGMEGPWLQSLRFSWSLEEAPRQLLRCRGLRLPTGTAGLSLEAGPRPGGQALSFSLDTAKAYHWMRFGGYLHWARYIVDTITMASPSPGSLVLDLGGGSGWMAAILRAHLGPQCDVLCTDIAEEALELARENFRENRLSVATEQGDLFEPVRLRGPPLPSFIFFYPPQDGSAVAESSWRGSPDVALRAPRGEAVHFHARFCREALLAPGGRAWLAVDWGLMEEVAGVCCEEGWEVDLPEALRDLTSAPSALLELRRARPGHSPEACVADFHAQASSAAEYQIRALGAHPEDAAARAASYGEAAKRGFAAGQLNYGAALAAGSGVEKDEAAAAQWLLRAAEAGEAAAQLNLGTLLAGRGEEGEAAEWWRKAAEQGHPRAQSLLASLFVEGQLPLSSDREAVRWLRRSAERGDLGAQLLLAKLHLRGEGVRQSNAEAAAWLRRAAASSSEVQEARALLQAAAHLEASGEEG